MLNEILDKAKALTDAIEDATNMDLWRTDLTDTVKNVTYADIKDQLTDLRDTIKETEKLIYDQDANNHPIWRELQVDPYEETFTLLDHDYSDPDFGSEWYKFYWEREEVWIEFQIRVTTESGRDWSEVEIVNWKSEEDTIKWLRDRDVDEDNELSNEYIIDEAHGLQEIVPFSDGFIINKEKLYED